MDRQVDVTRLRKQIRDEILREFAEVVRNVKSGSGSLSDVAAQLGISRQALSQYAEGAVPQSDVLLVAFLVWDWVLRIENIPGSPAWCEFSVSDMEGGVKKRRQAPVQLSLFEALADLDGNIEVLKKSVGRVESEIERAFGKRA
jgi:hypothetical protein